MTTRMPRMIQPPMIVPPLVAAGLSAIPCLMSMGAEKGVHVKAPLRNAKHVELPHRAGAPGKASLKACRALQRGDVVDASVDGIGSGRESLDRARREARPADAGLARMRAGGGGREVKGHRKQQRRPIGVPQSI